MKIKIIFITLIVMNFINARNFCHFINLYSNHIFLVAGSRLELSSCNHYTTNNLDYTVIELIYGEYKSLSLKVTHLDLENNEIGFLGKVVTLGGFGFRKEATNLKVRQLLNIRISSEKVKENKSNLE